MNILGFSSRVALSILGVTRTLWLTLLIVTGILVILTGWTLINALDSSFLICWPSPLEVALPACLR